MAASRSVKPRTVDIAITDTSGNPLIITLTRLTRAGNRDFASQIRPIILQNCASMVQHAGELKSKIDDTITSLAATGGEIPSVVGVQAALAPEGMAILLRIMTKDAHPVPIDDLTVDKLLTEYFEETFSAIKNLIPIPSKGVG